MKKPNRSTHEHAINKRPFSFHLTGKRGMNVDDMSWCGQTHRQKTDASTAESQCDPRHHYTTSSTIKTIFYLHNISQAVTH